MRFYTQKLILTALTIASLSLIRCGGDKYNPHYAQEASNPAFYHAGIRRVIDIVRHDIFPPTVASRIYTYTAVAGYEAMVPGNPEYRSLAGQLKGLEPAPQPEAGKVYCYPLAGVNAVLTTGKALIFSEADMEALRKTLLEDFKKINMPNDVYKRSLAYGEAVAKHILAWSKKDNYAQTRSAPKFAIDTNDPARWEPTPPNYDPALEPHWRTIRTWVMDSAAQFRPAPPIAFDAKKGSDFYKMAQEVYDIRKNLTPEQEAIAWYWDDNPFATQVSGHFSYAVKKISPAGHWLNIVAQVCRKTNADIMRTAETYVKVSCAIADGFICCWDEKYRSCVLRPETYINRYVVDKNKDEIWTPLIQTPPFPEHTSGHSTISAAAATVLTNQFGDNFAFTDSTEVQFGLPVRTFPSFQIAADEVGMSRLYGGIHYRHGNVEGLKAGRRVGQYVVERLKTK
jgi:PAP2 superfamily